MNFIYYGRQCDLNVGNGKTVSAVGQIINSYIQSDESRPIFSNIKLNHIEYTPLLPTTLDEALEVDNALVLLDEIHAIVHKNHRITERCKRHDTEGLCYLLSEFLRQVRKRHIDTHSTAQDKWDVHYQYRVVMQTGIVCEKFHITEEGNLKRCTPEKYTNHECPTSHEHWIKQTNDRTGTKTYFDPEPYYGFYNSFEIVKGWVSYD